MDDNSALVINDGPNLAYTLEEDLSRKEQLSGFRGDSSRKTALHKENEQQLLEEGKLAGCEFSARLQNVIFGMFHGQPACRILFVIDFYPKNRSWFRFRSATVDVGLQEERPIGSTSVDEDRRHNGPIVCKFYPELIRGHTRSIAETYNFSLSTNLPPPINNTNIS